jgi:hypothetical protein
VGAHRDTDNLLGLTPFFAKIAGDKNSVLGLT